MVILPAELKEPVTPTQEINKAFEECKFGRFHIRLLITTFSGCIASILVTTSTSFLLPIAECDLNMNLKEKGLLTAMPLIGMFISSAIAGFLNDTFGRILFLKIGYGGLTLFSVLSALSQNYVMFAAGKFGEGFSFALAASGIFSITSEFCHPTVRDRVMLVQASFSAMAQIICPAMAWLFLIQDWKLSLFDGAFVLKAWNFFLLALSLWAFIGYTLYSTLPESPRFLVTQNKYIEAKKILIRVYTENTGKSAETFPNLSIWEKEIKEEMKTKDNEKHIFKEFRNQLVIGFQNMSPLLQKPLFSYLVLIGLMQLAVIVTYAVLKMWFPQLSTIVEHYKLGENQNLCVSLDKYMIEERIRISNSTLSSPEVCVPHISGTDTYVNSIIMGLVCIVPYFVSGVIVNKLGKKVLMILTTIISIGALLGIRWAISNTMMVAMFSIDVAMTQMMKSLTQMVLVEVFPTTMRSLAMSIVTSIAILGSLVGNIAFPILLDFGCEIPFYTLTGIMLCFIVMAFFTPKKEDS